MSGLDPLIHAPARLQLCAILAAVDEAQFATLRDQLEVSDSVLSKHLAALSEVRYVKVRKEVLGKQRATWVKLTSIGRHAFAEHVRALRALLDVPLEAPAGSPADDAAPGLADDPGAESAAVPAREPAG